jgi:hypothetical protein
METSLELVPRDGVNICMGATVCLPPICCHTKELVRGKKTFSRSVHWAITSFFSTPLSQSSASMRSLACEKVVGEFAETPLNEIGVVVEVEVLAAGELAGWAAYY